MLSRTWPPPTNRFLYQPGSGLPRWVLGRPVSKSASGFWYKPNVAYLKVHTTGGITYVNQNLALGNRSLPDKISLETFQSGGAFPNRWGTPL